MDKLIKNKIKTHRWITSINRLLPKVNTLHHKSPDLNLQRFRDLVSAMIINHGEDYTVKRLKAFRLVIQQYVLKQTVTPVPFCKSDTDGFPRIIKFLKPDLNDAYSARYSLSFIRIIDTFRSKPEYNVSTITDNSTAKQSLVEEIIGYIRTWKPLKNIETDHGYVVMSNRAGPNGPASVTATQDLSALKAEPELWSDIKELLAISLPYLKPDSLDPQEGSYKHSKLVLLSDIACKTRIIAIADWWTNSALSFIHKGFMKWLRSLPGDITYRQSEIPKLIQGLGLSLYSSDMTAFTDRFPLEIEVAVVEAAYGCTISGLWSRVIANRTFYHKNGSVRYNCGNPMGILSSWAVSTAAHHAVKAWCADKIGKKRYKYLILGDDTLDTDRQVYDLYTRTINDLGVNISLSKCTQSELGYAELAKRYFTPHGEVTGIPVHLLEGLYNKPEQFLELVRICRERGYEDSFLAPCVLSLLERHKNGKLIADMLSLPEVVSGAPPLLEVNVSRPVSKIFEIPEEDQKTLLALARNYVFWSITDRLNKPIPVRKVCQVTIEPHHPLVFGLTEQLEGLLPQDAYGADGEEDEYYVYNQWMEGNYRHLAIMPSVDTYRFYNKGHKVTRCKFDVFCALLALLRGDTKISLIKPTKLKDFDLYDLYFDHLQNSLFGERFA